MLTKLAIHGGQPVRQFTLPYGRQWIQEDDLDAVRSILVSDYLTTGPTIRRFEEAFAEKVGAKYAVAISNGTAALHAIAFAAGIGPGDEVIVPATTFAATANCVLYQGGKPVFADIDSRTYNMDPTDVRKKITPRTKAIIPVDLTGQPANLDEFRSIADEYGLALLEDAAHALGAEYKGRRIGSISDMTEFSLHPVKQMTTGEGGVITTNDEGLHRKLELFRTHGITRDRSQMMSDEGPWYYEQLELGYNYRMTDIQAALGISQLSKLNEFVAKRRRYAEMYNRLLRELDAVVLPHQSDEGVSSWHLYVIQLRPELLTTGRREIFEAIRAEGIGVNVHYMPVYYHPYYQRLGYKKGICPIAEQYYDRALTLPLFPMMSEEDLDSVVRALYKVLAYYRR